MFPTDCEYCKCIATSKQFVPFCSVIPSQHAEKKLGVETGNEASLHSEEVCMFYGML